MVPFTIHLAFAALVKLLRKGLKEMSAKSTAFVNAGLEYERNTQAEVSSSASKLVHGLARTYCIESQSAAASALQREVR